MVLLEKADVKIESGIPGDHRGGSEKRQITVVSHESWEEAKKEVGKNLPWTARRANLFIEGIPLIESTEKFLNIGDIWLQITGETKPCERMDQYYDGLQEALKPRWRGGVTCKVLQSGHIKLGDKVEIREDFIKK